MKKDKIWEIALFIFLAIVVIVGVGIVVYAEGLSAGIEDGYAKSCLDHTDTAEEYENCKLDRSR